MTLTATAPGFTQVQGTATVGDVGLQLSGLSTSPTALSPNDEFSVNIGVLNASGAVVSIQALRVGAPSMTVTVSHTNTAIGQLVTGTWVGQSRTVTISAGQSIRRARLLQEAWPSTRLAGADDGQCDGTGLPASDALTVTVAPRA